MAMAMAMAMIRFHDEQERRNQKSHLPGETSGSVVLDRNSRAITS